MSHADHECGALQRCSLSGRILNLRRNLKNATGCRHDAVNTLPPLIEQGYATPHSNSAAAFHSQQQQGLEEARIESKTKFDISQQFVFESLDHLRIEPLFFIYINFRIIS